MGTVVLKIALIISFGFSSTWILGSGFVDITNKSQMEFKHINGMTGELWIVEIMGAGVGVLDFNGDGLLDVWLVQSGNFVENHEGAHIDQLFKNTSSNASGIQFKTTTGLSGVRSFGYGMGIATGDVDNDGDFDVFIANYGKNQLFENLGNSKFREIVAFYKDSLPEWSIGGSFIDYDSDGLLDLYVVNYIDFTLDTHTQCLGFTNEADYCAPTAYQAQPDRLLKNIGDFVFVDVSRETGILEKTGRGLGSIVADLNGDAGLDIYVANDPSANFYWQNNGKGEFKEIATLVGAAFNGNGKAEASMGLDAIDHDNDCDVDIFMTNLTSETNTLLLNSSKGWFSDATNTHGLGATSLPYTGFGGGWNDFDLDGDLDLFVVNGAVSIRANRTRAKSESPLAQRNQFWERSSTGRYVEFLVGDFHEKIGVSRGAVSADLDNDGDRDLIVTNNGGLARVFENKPSVANNWLGFTVKDGEGIGYHAVVTLLGKVCESRRVRTDGSYASAGDPRVLFGLGSETADRFVKIRWGDGEVAKFGPFKVNQYHEIQR